MITLAGYTDLHPIGRGGVGDVHRAVRRSTGVTVAVKVLRDVSDESAAWRRTRRELAALVALDGHAVPFDAVHLGTSGRIACAAAGNLFVAQGDTLITPPVSEGALPGIIRAALLDVNEIDGMRIEEAAIEMATLHASPAIFITNSLNGIAAAAYIAATEAQKKQGLALNEALPEFDKF